MSKLPSMPFYPADFFAATAHISGEAAAVYLVLLVHAWPRAGYLPSDDASIARIARISRQKWVSIKAEVLPFWDLSTEHAMSQKRLIKDHALCIAKVASNSEKGIRGNEKRWGTKQLNFNGVTIANGIAKSSSPDRKLESESESKDSFNGNSRQESRWVPTKRVGGRLFKAGEHAPAYEGQSPDRWQPLKPEDCQ